MAVSAAPEQIVDSYLLCVSADPHRREASFRFRTPDGEQQIRLVARDVDRLRINDFLEQNIVQEVRISGGRSDPGQTRILLAVLLFDTSNASEVEQALQAELEERTRSVLDGRKILVEIEPVYGASVLLLAGSIEWE